MKFSLIFHICTYFISTTKIVGEGTQSFLEMQRKLAEEQWRRDQEQATKEAEEPEEQGEDEAEEYYLYYYDENEPEETKSAAEINVNIALEKRKSRGFKTPMSSGLMTDFLPFSTEMLIEDAKQHTQCLQNGEDDPAMAAYKVSIHSL
jgi:hypothetical protein